MNCQEVQPRLLDYQRGRLREPAALEAIQAHLEGCSACAREEAGEQALTKALEERLPQHAAPLALKRRLAAQWPMPSVPGPSEWSLWERALVPAFAVAAVLLVVMPARHPKPWERHNRRRHITANSSSRMAQRAGAAPG
jgi:hypothetical protein